MTGIIRKHFRESQAASEQYQKNNIRKYENKQIVLIGNIPCCQERIAPSASFAVLLFCMDGRHAYTHTPAGNRDGQEAVAVSP